MAFLFEDEPAPSLFEDGTKAFQIEEETVAATRRASSIEVEKTTAGTERGSQTDPIWFTMRCVRMQQCELADSKAYLGVGGVCKVPDGPCRGPGSTACHVSVGQL